MNGEAAIRVAAISGSLRRVSSNTAIVTAAALLAPAGVRVDVYDALGDLPPFNPDIDDAAAPAAVRALRLFIDRADAVLISSPEYAHGVPGVLKNALDWLVESGEMIDKPIAIINASSRATHAWSSLVETLTTMSATVVRAASITLPLDGRRLDAAGVAAEAAISAALRAALETLVAATARARSR